MIYFEVRSSRLLRLDLAGRFDMVCEANRGVKDDSRLWGDDVLKEFDYGEVRDGSITRQAQEVKSNCLKCFYSIAIQKEENTLYMHSTSIQIKEKRTFVGTIGLLGPLPIIAPKGDHAPDSNTLF